jgi:hypothetical protein
MQHSVAEQVAVTTHGNATIALSTIVDSTTSLNTLGLRSIFETVLGSLHTLSCIKNRAKNRAFLVVKNSVHLLHQLLNACSFISN